MAQSKRLELQTLGRPQNSWHKHVLWNFCNSLLAPSSLYYSSMLTLQGRLNSWPLSWIHLFDTHFWPTKTGHAACLVSNIPSPLRYKLYQNAAAPYKYILSIDFFSSLQTHDKLPCNTKEFSVCWMFLVFNKNQLSFTKCLYTTYWYHSNMAIHNYKSINGTCIYLDGK